MSSVVSQSGEPLGRPWDNVSAAVGLAVMIEKPETYPLLWHGTKWVIGSPTGQQFTLDASMPRDQLVQTVDNAVRQEEARSGHKVEPNIRDAILNLVDDKERARDQAAQVWLFTIIPPVALLLLGVTIGWVIGGFRRDKAQPS